jgi:hypothetical protein
MSVENPLDKLSVPTPKPEVAYTELCAGYLAIEDFRGKLLGFLPLATGGIFLYAGKSGEGNLSNPKFSLAFGIFGFLITLGLFAFELYGIRRCTALIHLGEDLENQLKIEGQFLRRPVGLEGWGPWGFLKYINEPMASGIIYPTVAAAWLYQRSAPSWGNHESNCLRRDLSVCSVDTTRDDEMDDVARISNPRQTETPPPKSDDFFTRAPTLSLPKGGGAIRGIGEKFAANPVTETGSMSAPIYTSPGRSGFGPQLSLSYDSGAGNGPFGFVWGLSLPSITRKTDKGLPRYFDTDESRE